MIDITILAERRYAEPQEQSEYIQNILLEDHLVQQALEKKGFRVTRKSWDDPDFDWTSTRFALFRTTWDYFDRFAEFSTWFTKTQQRTTFIHPPILVHWNMDKHYLADLHDSGINIAPTYFFERGESRSLDAIVTALPFDECIMKPASAGTARHTYRFTTENAKDHAQQFAALLEHESMLVQEYQHQITTKGEISLMLFGGTFSHAVLKKAKPGDFRVQDDFGGTVHDHHATHEEIAFAEKCLQACPFETVYARVDIFWDNADQLCLAELELIEPELWFRKNKNAATRLADALKRTILNAK